MSKHTPAHELIVAVGLFLFLILLSQLVWVLSGRAPQPLLLALNIIAVLVALVLESRVP